MVASASVCTRRVCAKKIGEYAIPIMLMRDTQPPKKSESKRPAALIPTDITIPINHLANAKF